MQSNINFYYKYDYILFDFDGVILNTNEIKNQSFRELFSEYPKNKIDEFIKYHKKNGGISRYVKIKYFLQKNKVDDRDQTLKYYLKKFSKIVTKKILKAKYVAGVRKFINHIYH